MVRPEILASFNKIINVDDDAIYNYFNNNNNVIIRINENNGIYNYQLLGNDDNSDTTFIDNIFTNNPHITSIHINSAFTSIGNSAFNGCSNLTSVDMKSVTSIGENVFNGCKNLTTINIPNVTSIGESAFNGCSNLITMYIPNATSIGDSAFNGCSNLITMTITNVTSIGKSAFEECSNLTVINIPNVEIIASNTFSGCSLLKTLIIPKVTSIEKYAFNGCYNLNQISLPSIIEISENTLPYSIYILSIDLLNCETVNERAFNDWSNITTINIPNVTTIGKNAFNGCKNLTTINIPKVTSIGEYVFNSCYNLTTIIISDSISIIGKYAFNGCKNLTTINIPKVTSIGESAFNGCSNLITMYIPKVEYIGKSAFNGCSNLNTMIIPLVTSINEYVFNGCSSLTTVNTSIVTSIGEYAFNGCSNLINILVSDSILMIEKYAFNNCYNLLNINIPKVEYIGESAFNGCSNLVELYLTKIKFIGRYAFAYCNNLIFITVPYNVSTIETDILLRDSLQQTPFSLYTTPLIAEITPFSSELTVYIRVPYTERFSDINYMSSYIYFNTYYSSARKLFELHDIPILNISQHMSINRRNIHITFSAIDIIEGFRPIILEYSLDNGNTWINYAYDQTNNYFDTIIIEYNPSYSKILLRAYSFGDEVPETNYEYVFIGLQDVMPLPVSNICFLAGTLVYTDQGYIPIDQINIKLNTINNKKIVAITKTVSIDKFLICFERNALGINIPFETTKISSEHLVFHNGMKMKAMDYLGKGYKVFKVRYNGEPLYNVLLEEHSKMLVHNLLCETLHPENLIARVYSSLSNILPMYREDIVKSCNNYFDKINDSKYKYIGKRITNRR